jgi:ribosomal-protein-alanine N-acetyltransferase
MSAPHYWLTTERLGLRRFTPDDFDWLVDLYSDAEVMRHLGGVKNRTQAGEVFQARIMGYYDQHPDLGVWMTVERSTGTPIGFHLLNHIRGEQMIQVGFTLAKAAWGKGYGTEMAFAVLRYGFVELRVPRISGMASLDNHASQRVLTKIGLIRNGERAFPHPDYASQGAMAWFERDAPAWIAERASGTLS